MIVRYINVHLIIIIIIIKIAGDHKGLRSASHRGKVWETF